MSTTCRNGLVIAWFILLGLVAWPARTDAQVVDDPFVAPVTHLSSDGRTASDGRRSLTVSKSVLAPGGEVITVTGAGFNEEKGVYVAFCVIPALNQLPTPCGGGIDLEGSSGAARWVSPASDTPSYGAGLTTPYEPGGKFSFTIAVSPQVNPTTDCRVVQCAVVSRNDHRRTSDRSQDVFVPITFSGAEAATASGGASAATPTPEAISAAGPAIEVTPASTAAVSSAVAPSTPEAATAPAAVAATPAAPPEVPAVLEADGRSVKRGAARLHIEGPVILNEAGTDVHVTGTGFDTSKGVFVALCALPAGGGKPGPCAAGPGSSAWLSSSPPDYARGLARPYLEDGSFDVTFSVKPVIDSKTDCRVVACAIGTRSDAEGVRASDSELFVPVSFAAIPVATTEPATAPASEVASGPEPVASAVDANATQDGRLDVVPLALVGLVVTLVLLAYSAVLLRRRRIEALR